MNRKANSKKKNILRFFFILVILFVALIILCAFTVDLWIVPLFASIFNINVKAGYRAHVSWINKELTIENLYADKNDTICEIGKLNLNVKVIPGKANILDRFVIDKIDIRDSFCSFTLDNANGNAESDTDLEAYVNHLDDFSLYRFPVEQINCFNCAVSLHSGKLPIQIRLDSLQGKWNLAEAKCLQKIESKFQSRIGDEEEYINAGCNFLLSPNENDSKKKELDLDFDTMKIALKNGKQFAVPKCELKTSLDEIQRDSVHFISQVKTKESFEIESLHLKIGQGISKINGQFQCNGKNLQLVCRTESAISNLSYDQIHLELKPSAICSFKLAYDFANGQMKLDSLDMEIMEQDEKKVRMIQNGSLIFQKENTGNLTLVPQDSSIHIYTENRIDLTPFDSIMPLSSIDNYLEFDSSFALDSGKVCLTGKTDFSVFRSKTATPYFSGHLMSETDGIADISAFRVTKSNFQYLRDNSPIFNADLTGEYNFTSMDLHGKVDYFPFRLADEFGYDLTSVSNNIKGFVQDDIRHQATGEFHFNLPKINAFWNFASEINGFGFTDNSGKKVPIQLSGEGTLQFDEQNDNWNLDSKIHGSSDDDIAIDLSIKTSNRDQISGELSISQAQHHFIKQCMNMYFDDVNFMEKLPVKELSSSCSYVWKIEHDFPEIDHTRLFMELDKKGSIEITGFHIYPDTSIQNILKTDFNVKLKDIPLQYCNLFIPENADFSFINGEVVADLKCTHPDNDKTLHIEGASLIRDVSNELDGYVRNFSRIGLSGQMDYDLSGQKPIQFSNLAVEFQDVQEQPLAFFAGKGTYSPVTGDTDFSFHEIRCGNELLNTILYDAEMVFALDEFNALGSMDYQIRDSFSTHTFTGNFKINKMQLASAEPEQYRFQPWHGNVSGSFTWANLENRLYGDASVELLTDKDEEVVSVSYLHTRERGGLPLIHSQSVNLAAALAYLNYNIPANPFLNQEEDPYEPPDFIPLSLQMDLSGLYAGREYHGASQFIMEFLNNQLNLKDIMLSGDFPGNGNAVFDFSYPKTRYQIRPHFTNAALEKIMALCSEFGADVAIEGLTGTLSNVEGNIVGEGFTKQDFCDNLDMKLSIKTGPIEYYTITPDEQESFFIRFLQLPFVLLPRFIDMLPNDVLKRLLHTVTGGSLWDAITGNQAVVFQNGEVNLQMKNGVLTVQNMKLQGQNLDSLKANGFINLLTDEEMRIEYVLQFGEIIVPLIFQGSYKDPELDETTSTIRFLRDNMEHILMFVPNIIFSTDDNLLLETFRSSNTQKDK